MLIRKATIKDADAISEHLLLAMEDIVYYFIGERDHTQALRFLRHFAGEEGNQYSYQNCWVVEENGSVIAAVNVYDGGLLQELRAPVIDYIKKQFQRECLPEDETGAGEYYLDSLGVDPLHRGKGIGTKIIAFLISEYVNQRGQTLGLLVDEDNPAAKRLYLKMGFSPVGSKHLFAKRLEHLQIKR